MKINETIMNIVKNVADFVFIVKFMRNETDHNAISKAFKKFRDFQTLKKFLLRGIQNLPDIYIYNFNYLSVIAANNVIFFFSSFTLHPSERMPLV